MLYSAVIEVSARVIPAQEDRCLLKEESRGMAKAVGTTNERLLVAKELDLESLAEKLKEVKAAGINSLAVVLMHSYT